MERTYEECRQKLFDALSKGRIREGIDEVLNDLYAIPVDDAAPRPVIAVTGDYYTRVVPFANNEVYREVEALGATLWFPPTFSDSFKMGALRDFAWSFRNGRSGAAARYGLFDMFMGLSEYKVAGSRTARRVLNRPTDLSGLGMWKTASNYAHTRLPSGITAPIASALQCLDLGADGVLNLMTLNCAFGTVVTARLLRALKERPGIAMLTLIYDGLKKTNEKTRLEAFMDQVRDHFESKVRDRPQRSATNWAAWEKFIA